MPAFDIPLPLFHSGKVRDTYEIPEHPDLLLMVASDRLSTHNVVHESPVPGKGELLTALTLFWTFDVLRGFKTHLVAWGQEIYHYVPALDRSMKLHLRAFVVWRKRPEPIEFIYRRYLAGSLAEACKRGEDPYDLHLAADLPRMHRFDEPVFTPTEKSDADDPTSPAGVEREYPASSEVTSLAFESIEKHLASKDITLIDAKFEADGAVLVDEWGTGDCCRLAWTTYIVPGEDPPWLDKEDFRKEAMRMWDGGKKVPLRFSDEAIRRGISRYKEAFVAITDQHLFAFQRDHLET
jgi:phosphoribosylaminoimidazole-succinocarboxamide synthase